jgi:NAD(P)-dependent dehydrogenase (short-subunit alcohol dehydrogenase family)
MKNFTGRVAAITGAGSGIGRALAVNLAGQGAHLALSDIDEVGLAETVALCEGAGVKVTWRRLDVADRSAVYAWADSVVADHEKVNLIFNNAGVALAATIESMSYEDFEWLMNINFWGVIYGSKAFLPHLKAAGEGHIVNISSVFGLSRPTTQPSSASEASPTHCAWSSRSKGPTCRVRRFTPAGSRPASPAMPVWIRASWLWPAVKTRLAVASTRWH